MSALSREIGSRGRADAVVADESEPPQAPDESDQATALRTELQQLRPSVLKKRAKAAGATEEEIEAAEDADDAKAATVALVVSYEQAAEDPAVALREELAGLKPSVLKKRARAAGATEEQIEEADDAEDPRAAMVALVLAQQ